MPIPESSRERRRLDSLAPHPLQARIFANLGVRPLRSLADDIERNGLQHPVEITSTGTIICGHQRFRAAQLLGWTEIDVIVRLDLEAIGEEAILERFLRDNIERRHLDEFANFRAVKALADLEWERSGSGDRRTFDERFFRGRGIAVSGKTLERRFKILALPSELVSAVANKRLSQSAALKVADLPQDVQATIAAAVAADEDPREVVAEYIVGPPDADAPDSPAAQYRVLVEWSATRLENLWRARGQLVGVAGDHLAVARQLGQLAKFATEMQRAESSARRKAVAKVLDGFRDGDS